MSEVVAGGAHPLKKRKKPELVTLDDGQSRIDTARWNHELIVGLIKDRGPKKWTSVERELSKVAWHTLNNANKQRARAYVSKLKAHAFDHGILIVEHRTPAEVHLKLFDPASIEDRQLFNEQLETMRDRGEIPLDRYYRTKAIYDFTVGAGEAS